MLQCIRFSKQAEKEDSGLGGRLGQLPVRSMGGAYDKSYIGGELLLKCRSVSESHKLNSVLVR